MRCNSYIHVFSEIVSVLKTTLGCGHPGLCSWLCNGVLNQSLVCHMMHQSDGQRGAAWVSHSQNGCEIKIRMCMQWIII